MSRRDGVLRDGDAAMPTELWVRWLWDLHPGAGGPTDEGALIDAVARGRRPLDIIGEARAYGRLMRCQEFRGLLSVERWLDGLGRSGGVEPVGPPPSLTLSEESLDRRSDSR